MVQELFQVTLEKNGKNLNEKALIFGMIFAGEMAYKLPMKKALLIFNLFLTFSLFSQELKEISGFVKTKNSPLKNVNIVVKNTNLGTKTNDKGYYSISVKKGDILSFSYVGMKTINIVIEDVTSILNIKMKVTKNMLNEVTITGKNNLDFGPTQKPNKFATGKGSIDTRKVGYGISFIDGKDLNPAAITIGQALVGRVGGYRLGTDRFGDEYAYLRSNISINLPTNAIWDVDGIVYQTAPQINLDQIIDIGIIRSLAGATAYGSAGRGGVIIIRTKAANYTNSQTTNSNVNPYLNKESYDNDAVPFKSIKHNKPLHLQLFDSISNAQEAYDKYAEIKSLYEDRPNFHFDLANYFLTNHNDLTSYQNILVDLEYYAAKNAEVLKALGYNYQKNGLNQKALAIYKQIMRLRPNYAQSFRDLANAYVQLEEYQKAWKIYRYYLQKGNTLEENAIGEIMYREMEALYISKSKIANIKDVFKRKENSPDDISSDIRMVFEWNTSEAEFALEFVNPQKQSYIIEHSLALSEELILDEKLKGYSSKDFIIDEIGTGNWLVNINYLGNKKYLPTYLKVTIYYNWGRPNQAELINLFKLTAKDIKIQLLNLNANTSHFFRNDN